MKPGEVVLTDLDRLLASDQDTEGRPVLPEGSRSRLVEELERLIVTREALLRHFRVLQDRLAGNVRHWELLREDLHEAVLSQGLGVLDDAALSALALSPLALSALHGWIYAPNATVPVAWQEAISRQTAAEFEKQGLGPLSRLLKFTFEQARRRGWKPGDPNPFTGQQ
jgi:hypothetical protein